MANSTRQEWLNHNAHRRFPLVEDSDLTCTDWEGGPDCDGKVPCVGGKELPDSLILDARFCLFGLEDGPVTLKSATIAGDGSASIVVDLPGRAGVEIGGSGVWSDGDEFSARITFGDPESLRGHAGSYRLCNPVPFLRSRVMSIPYGIGADTLSCGGVTAHGDIRVVDGHNTSLDIHRNNLVLSLHKGWGLGVECPSVLSAYTCDGNMLYYLNGQKADSSGNIDIIGGEGVTVATGTYRGIPAVIVLTSPVVNNFAYR